MSSPASRLQALKAAMPKVDWPFVIVAGLSLGSGALVLARSGFARFLEIFEEDALLFLAVLPKVALGTLIGAFVRVLVSREQMVRYVGAGSGLRGLLIATFAGTLFPGGPFTIFPMAAVFMLGGADRGAAIAFISAWLLIGVNRMVVWEMPFLGPDFVLWRTLLCLPLPLIAGFAGRAAVFDRLDDPPPG